MKIADLMSKTYQSKIRSKLNTQDLIKWTNLIVGFEIGHLYVLMNKLLHAHVIVHVLETKWMAE